MELCIIIIIFLYFILLYSFVNFIFSNYLAMPKTGELLRTTSITICNKFDPLIYTHICPLDFNNDIMVTHSGNTPLLFVLTFFNARLAVIGSYDGKPNALHTFLAR